MEVEQKEQKRCIAETALRGHYGGIVRRVVAITRQVREEQCKKQSSRFLHSSSCPRKHSSTDSVYCDVPCTFCRLALGCTVRCHAHYVSSRTRKVVSCSSTLLRSRSFLFPLLEGFTFASEDFFIRSSSSSSSL